MAENTKIFIIRLKGFMREPMCYYNIKEWHWEEENEFIVFTITTNRDKRTFHIKKDSIEGFGERERL